MPLLLPTAMAASAVAALTRRVRQQLHSTIVVSRVSRNIDCFENKAVGYRCVTAARSYLRCQTACVAVVELAVIRCCSRRVSSVPALYRSVCEVIGCRLHGADMRGIAVVRYT